MEDLFSMIEKSMKNTGRDYGDVRISDFDCGCKIVTARGDPQYTVFREICDAHREDCGKIIGKDAVDRIILKDSDFPY